MRATVAVCLLNAFLLTGCNRVMVEPDGQMVRLAKLVIDDAHLDAYKAALA